MVENHKTTINGLDVWVRTEKKGDWDVIGEVLTGNCYKLDQLKATGFEPKTIVDLGSHIGTFSILAHSIWPDARIICIEPNTRSFELLELNCPFAERINAALTYEEHVILTDDKNQATGGGFICTPEDFKQKAQGKEEMDSFIYKVVQTEVPTITFEELIEQKQITHIDLFKMDCEGGEFQLLEHATPESLAKIGRIVGEYHTHKGFDYFKYLAESKLPHLEVIGGNGQPIGPFFSKERSMHDTSRLTLD